VPDQIRIESFDAQPLPDRRRVTLMLRVSGLPAYGPGAGPRPIDFPDMSPAAEKAEEETVARRPPTPYPDVTLSILNEYGHIVATTYVVEHKDSELDFTLHLPASEPGALFIARAEMTKDDELIQEVRVPFEMD
jgi:hypothetical protein